MLHRHPFGTEAPLIRRAALCLAVLLAAAPLSLEAQGPPWRPRPDQHRPDRPRVDQQELQRPPHREEAEPRLSLDEAAALVRQRTGGRVVRADRRQQGDRLIYEIRILTDDGRVRTYRVDAATGAMR
jgi:hypothetical protein